MKNEDVENVERLRKTLNEECSASIKKERVSLLKKMSNWFEIELTISILGVQVVRWKFPPDNQKASKVDLVPEVDENEYDNRE